MTFLIRSVEYETYLRAGKDGYVNLADIPNSWERWTVTQLHENVYALQGAH
jgi:hypothetical protein